MKFDEKWNRVVEFFARKHGFYGRCFNTPDGKAVLHDLSEFCRANESTFDPDPRMHAVLEGRREVWLRIQEYLHLSPDQLAEMKAVNMRMKNNGNS